MNKTSIIGVGGGGHSRVLLDILLLLDEYHIVGVTDDALKDKSVRGFDDVAILGSDVHLEKNYELGVRHAFIGVGSLGARKAIASKLGKLGFILPSLVHPGAIVSSRSAKGAGCQIMANAVINPCAKLGDNVIINSGAIVEHDSEIGDFSHIAPGATLGGGVKVGESAHVGIGSTIREGLTIGAGAFVAAGAVVVNDVKPGSTVMGVPAKTYLPK